jgi:WhiB family redox-sensing transcriptional regulator
MTIMEESNDWRKRAACLGMEPEIFYPTYTYGRGLDEAIDRAKEICRKCPVVSECLEDALSRPLKDTEGGIWGGTTDRERRRLRRNHATPRFGDTNKGYTKQGDS